MGGYGSSKQIDEPDEGHDTPHKAQENGKGSMALALHDDAGPGMENVVMCIPGRYLLCRHLRQ